MRFPPLFLLALSVLSAGRSHRWIEPGNLRLRRLWRGRKQNQICKNARRKRVGRIPKRRKLFSGIRHRDQNAELSSPGDATGNRAALAFSLSKSYNSWR
jgi:hypothetical protein